MSFMRFALLGTLCLLTPSFGQQKADLVITNGKVFTASEKIPKARAVAIAGEKILAVGTDEEIRKFTGPATKVLDVQGKLVIPGLIDSHTHFAGGGHRLATLDVAGLKSVEQIQEEIAARAKELPRGTPIFATGSFPADVFPGLGWPTREILDKAAPDNPVVVSRTGGHALWVNTMALKLSGIDAKTQAPYGGEIVKDPKTGEPTGILKEGASRLQKVEMSSTPKDDIERALQYTLNLALTGVTTHTDLEELEAFRQLDREGRLTLRIYASLPLRGVDDYVAKGIKRGQGDSMLRLGLLKGFIDGTIGVRSALMFEPFSEEPGNSGLAQYGEAEFDALVAKADKAGYQIAVHAIGDKGVNWVLNAFERAQRANGASGMRHRVEHATVNIVADLKRFRQLGVIASMQPNITGPEEYRVQRLGNERAKRVDMWRSLLENGAMLSWGTDWPVSALNPMLNLQKLVTRYPEQRLTMQEAIRYYTYGSAYAAFEEDVRGTLEPGKLADIVVLSKDLFTIPPEEIPGVETVYKFVGGKLVYQRK